MKRVKKLLSVVVASTFMFTLAAPFASAADVNASINRLNALGVVTGYTNGEFKPEQNITRAEFAAVAVRLLGLEAAAGAAKGNTKFGDVTGSHWASGYINLAVGNGIVKGYPNGTFKPEANVTNAEAFAMLVRVLGYDPVVQGQWPQNYIGKAAQLGLLDGVSLGDYNAVATRGTVFTGADNALDEKVLIENGYDNQGKVSYLVDTLSLMEKRLNVTKKAEGTVVNVPNYGTDKGKVTIDPTPADTSNSDAYTVEVASNVDANANYGEKVVVWVKDNKAFFFDVKTNASDVIIDEVDANATSTSVKLKGKDKTYDFATSPTIKRNFADAATTDIVKGDKVKVILDSNGKVAFVEAWSYTPAVVEEVKVSDEKIIFENEGSLEVKNDVFTIVKGGKAITLADIKAGDVVDYVTNGAGDRHYIFVTSEVVTGKLNAAIDDSGKYKLTIGDKTIKTLDTAAMRYSTDAGKTWKSVVDVNTFKSLFGKDVTVCLNKDGKAVYVVASSEATSAEVTVWIKDVVRDSSVVNEKTYVKVGKFDGTNTMYEVTKDADYNDIDVIENNLKLTGAAAEIANGTHTLANTTLAKLALTSDGKVDYIKDYASDEIVTGAVYVDKDNKTITTDAGTFKVTDETKIIYKDGTTDTADVKTMSWDAFKSLAFGGSNQIGNGAATPAGVDVQVVYKDGKVQFIAIAEDVNATTDYKYGVITVKGTNANGSFVEFNQKGTLAQFEGTTGEAKETLVRFKLKSDNKIDTVTALDAISRNVSSASYDTFVVKSVNKADRLIEVAGYNTSTKAESANTIWLLFSANAEVYDVKDGVVAKTMDDLTKGDKIQMFDPMDKDAKDMGASADGVMDFFVRNNDL